MLSTSSVIKEVFLLLLWSTISALSHDNDDLVVIQAPQVETFYGPVKGFYMEQGMQAYLGIPYAKPPLNELRWHPPVEPKPWGPEALNAFSLPHGCPQYCKDDYPDVFCPEKVDEDCLYLNIWTPRDANPTSNLPVVLFIHGGSFNAWSASSPLFDGRFVAEISNVVFVSANYRLGALGWLKTEGKDSLTGNYGLMDQRAVMRFVHENIRNFGGNPNKVTLQGQSAGSQSITIHMGNPETDAYFHQAILQSNPLTIPLANVTEAVKLSTKFAGLLNCSADDTSCLRSKTVDEVLLAQQKSSAIPIDFRNPFLWFEQWGPVVDGVEIPQQLLADIAAGKLQRKPLIIGVTTNESANYVYSFFPTTPPPLLIISMTITYFGRYTLPILEEYWEESSLDLRPILSEIISDYIYVCPARNMTRYLESFSAQPLYHYVFNHTFEDSDVWQEPGNPCTISGISCHDTDMFFTFYALTLSGYEYTPAERRLARSMMHYWANFAHTGDPNNNDWRTDSNDIVKPVADTAQTWNLEDEEIGRLFWPQYTETNMWQSLYFRTPLRSYITDFNNDKCDLWDIIGYDEPVGPLSPNNCS